MIMLIDLYIKKQNNIFYLKKKIKKKNKKLIMDFSPSKKAPTLHNGGSARSLAPKLTTPLPKNFTKPPTKPKNPIMNGTRQKKLKKKIKKLWTLDDIPKKAHFSTSRST